MKNNLKSCLLIFIALFLFACDKVDFENYELLNSSFCPRDNCADSLISFIESANSSLYCAIYNLNDESVVESLLEKSKQIQVMVIVDESSKIDVFEKYESKGLMHHKFCVKDEEYVFTGSYNPTIRGSYFNNNNVLVFRSKFLYVEYLNEFYDLLGLDSLSNPFQSNISVHFSLRQDAKAILIDHIKQAKHRIFIAAYTFTDPDIADLLIEKNLEGVNVSVIFEKKQNSKYSQYNRLHARGIGFLDNNTYTMHHKFFILDDKVITGSYNPTRNAYRNNRENFLVINDKEILQDFLYEFDFLSKRFNQYNFSVINLEGKLLLFVDNKFIELNEKGWFFINDLKYRYELKKNKVLIYDFHNNNIDSLEVTYDVK